ncbi:MAG: hypothetical protein DMF61_17555 [Blastocatellia bacterium AA13]|nr:MAG: hypothetical protein DMF61_17555 [Blastocatellia bacterium AA13]
MDVLASTFSYKELNLLLFALTGGAANDKTVDAGASCESACPIIDEMDHLLDGRILSAKDRLIRHLNNHLREGLIESGMFEHLAISGEASTGAAELQRINQQLDRWSCEIALDSSEKTELKEYLLRLPRSAWVAMPLTMWRLRRKLVSTS